MRSRRISTPAVVGRRPRPSRWYATAPFTRLVEVGRGAERVPVGPMHAKEPGTRLTACGADAATWPRLWSIRFVEDSRHDKCPACERVVHGESARG